MNSNFPSQIASIEPLSLPAFVEKRPRIDAVIRVQRSGRSGPGGCWLPVDDVSQANESGQLGQSGSLRLIKPTINGGAKELVLLFL